MAGRIRPVRSLPPKHLPEPDEGSRADLNRGPWAKKGERGLRCLPLSPDFTSFPAPPCLAVGSSGHSPRPTGDYHRAADRPSTFHHGLSPPVEHSV